MDRPKSLNTINVEMTEELEQLVAWLLGYPHNARVVLFAGAGDAFCTGDDATEL